MINLFINSFEHQDEKRNAEIKFCLKKNLKNKLIDKVIIVNENRRATYGDFLRAMASYKKDINIIANTDIYFNDTISFAENIEARQCFALTRWENHKGHIISFVQRHGRKIQPQWSQDAWIFRGSPVNPVRYDHVTAVNLKNRTRENIPFSLGIPGCDNKFAAMLKINGMTVLNPSHQIKSIHVHESDERVYPDYQIIAGIKPKGLVPQVFI